MPATPLQATGLTPEQRSQRARIAALARWSREDPAAQGAKMRAGFDQRFLDEVDPDRVLPEAERERRAACARKRYFTDLAYKSAKARRERAS